MKKHLLFIFLLTRFFVLLGYDYQTAYSHRTIYFESTNGQIETMKIDSIHISDTDSILFPIKNIQRIENFCHVPFGSGWLGSKIIVKKDWNYFFNNENDTIKIKTSAQLNEKFSFVQNNHLTIIATVIKCDTLSFLGIIDSVKTYQLTVYDKTMSVLPHILDKSEICISKNYGIINSFNLLYLGDFLHIDFIYMDHYKLVGMTSPNLGVQNLKWFEVFDFQSGDELHIITASLPGLPPIVGNISKEQTILKYLERKDFNDSIQYRLEITDFKDLIYSKYQTQYTIVPNKHFDIEPSIPYFDSHQGLMTNIQIKDIKSFPPYPILNGVDSCWSPILADGCFPSYGYYRGLGGPYYWCKGFQWEEESRQLVYYKKGNSEWGTPLKIYPKYFDKNNVWTFHNWSMFYIDQNSNDQNYIDGDIEMNGKTYKKVNNLHFDKYGINTGGFGFIREENGKLYGVNSRVNNSEEFLMYDFTLDVGDTLKIKYLYGTEVKDVTITKIDTLEFLNGEKSRAFYTSHGLAYAEGIGSLYMGLFAPFLPIMTCGCNSELTCYKEGDVQLYINPSFCVNNINDCCDVRKAKVDQIKQINFSISPNPAKDILKITLNEPIYESVSATIVNSLGKTVLVQNIENQQQTISIKDLPNGIYLLQIEKRNARESVKFIKQ